MTAEPVPIKTTSASAPPKTGPRTRRRPLISSVVGLIIVVLVARYGYAYYIDSTQYVTTNDALIDANMVPVAPLVSGTLAIWRVKLGDTVRAGQVIGQINPITGSDYVNIIAPIAGTILQVNSTEGQVVGQAQALAYVADLTAMRVTAYIAETEIAKIRLGQAVEVTVDTHGSTVYHGTVSEVLPAAVSSFAFIPSSDRTTSNFTKVTQRIEIHIDIGATNELIQYSGASASVRIRTA